MKTTCRFGVYLLALAGLFGCGAAWGQTNGAIRGIVNDPSGAVVPGATVSPGYRSGFERSNCREAAAAATKALGNRKVA